MALGLAVSKFSSLLLDLECKACRELLRVGEQANGVHAVVKSVVEIGGNGPGNRRQATQDPSTMHGQTLLQQDCA
ncbi:hypothetical protein NDU88_005867 [Pleurodeles waltl]|uniref:Uncharacterized protein n=1 Tax=Pleurodeles waltl TaxID=8319 RepID=A0AAV7PK39_PLEWA|nr:hypothetical protein NDU88_005867 [Pleurodeles waltl]